MSEQSDKIADTVLSEFTLSDDATATTFLDLRSLAIALAEARATIRENEQIITTQHARLQHRKKP